MPRNYGRDDDEAGCYDGTGGAAGRYGSQTPLDPLHRSGGSEAEERERYQAEETTGDPAPFGATFPVTPCE
jgi:hypothetical protein